MCEYCGMVRCPSPCPGYLGVRSDGEKPISACALCQTSIYKDDIRFFNGELTVCEDCARYMGIDDLKLICNITSGEELLSSLGFVRQGGE